MDKKNKKENFSEDELIAPNWIDDLFLKKVLSNCLGIEVGGITINKTKITPGTSKNDHYASIMFRAAVEFSTQKRKNQIQKKSLIIKTVPVVDGVKKELLENMFPFETEIGMYSEALPKIEGILRKYGDGTVLAAKSLYHSLSPHKVIVFEDLVELGYGTIDRPTNLEDAKCALTKLAKLHAVSYKLGLENDKLVTSYREGAFNCKTVLEMDFIKDIIPNFKTTLNQFDDLRQYIQHVEKIEDILLTKCVEAANAYLVEHPNGIFVLNHGDFHLKNMMFKRKLNGDIIDVMLVDYQMSFFGPAVVDLLYSFVMFMSRDLRTNHRDELLYFYFTIFRDTLKLIDFQGKPPTMADFRMELIKYRYFELLLYIGFLPMVNALTEDDTSAASMVEDPNYRKNLFTSPKFIDEIREVLPKFLNLGYFE